MNRKPLISANAAQSAFTLVEVMVASGIMGIIFSTIMGGFWLSFQSVQLDRENSRATQIMLEKTELVRLYNWNQILGTDTNAMIPTTFTSPFYPGSNNGGFNYSGMVTIASAPLTETYASDMRQVTIGLSWTSGKVLRSRSMTTSVSKYGLANYIY
jgi:prepilin-type N-terminal cleavage/methylation domain-containing protein